MRIYLPCTFSARALVGLAIPVFWLAVTTCTFARDIDETSTDASGAPSLEAPFVYQTEGRPDPFKPFITPRPPIPQRLDPDEIVEVEAELTGMQLFEPGQLTLVGILGSGSKRIAMVEDQTHQGYLLQEGMLIGRRGVVTRIEPQQVIITETAYTRAGEEVQDTIIMRLTKEGDR
ncbi:pilus assembly protein PilP [Desulfobulbus alkaliphilus]|uniref:pilus assembly protein PilP n=1 Tax=Desulfobulbus alkaliphilus TaxID=869814 RepID=UPI001962A760|nr:pilus assembly protein PilP [Desulfobulbus alkaliphilus]MBM9536601.1 pilus assembly protein PilP [Desulfobulbus alkaliphilus]